MELKSKILGLLMMSILLPLLGCIQPNKAKIEFTNQTDKKIKTIVITSKHFKDQIGSIDAKQSFTWIAKLPEQSELKISIEFESGQTIDHREPFFNNQRGITVKINDTGLKLGVLSEGYL